MIEKVMCDYVALHDMFAGLSEDGERKIKHKVRLMLDTEAYMYLKYRMLQQGTRRLETGLQDDPVKAWAIIQTSYTGDNLAKSLEVKEIKPRESHFRGKSCEK